MSQTAAIRRPEPQRAPAQPKRQIEVVPSRAQRRARPKFLHAIIAVAGVGAIIGAQLALSIGLSAGAYRIGDLQDQQRDLQRTQESLDEQLQVLSSTQHLASNAAALGMVPGGSQFYLDLASGGVAAAPGMPDPFGCGNGCTLVPNSLTSGLALATAPVGAKVVGTVAKPVVDAAAVGVVAGAETAAGEVAPIVSAPVDAPVVATSPETPVASDALPSPGTH